MTEQVFAATMAAPDDPDAFDEMAPENVAPLVVWLGCPDSAGITGRVFEAGEADYVTVSSFVQMDAGAATRFAPGTSAIAEAEGLVGHARAMNARADATEVVEP